uniref:Uncharacterized protein n=1 Tax=Arundo donax TaxID=35708 RepID=A0A0A9AKV5_ARUDO
MSSIDSTHTILHEPQQLSSLDMHPCMQHNRPNYDNFITLKYGYHLELFLILSGISLDGDLIISFLSSPIAYKTSLKYLLTVSMDFLNDWWITLKR